MNRIDIEHLAARAALFAFIATAAASSAPAELTVEQQDKLDQCILDDIALLRVSEPQPQPPMVAEFNAKYTELCRKRAEAEYEAHGRWFYCEDKSEFNETIRWDEVVTYRTYWQLYARYGSLEQIPNYSKENHEEAIHFWQKWQKEDGAFFNFLLGKGDSKTCNGKYVSIILSLLGAEPLHKTSGYGADQLNTEECLDQIADGQMNHGTATVSVMLRRIDEGQTEYIPVLERAVELAVSQLSPYTGMFHGPEGRPSDVSWAAYSATAETMKGMLRLLAYMGVENMPYRHMRADTLLAYQEEFRKSGISVKRNTAEMLVQCLLESPYRRDELLEALDGHAGVILEGTPWESHISGDYAAYILMMFGAYLNWEGYDGRGPRTSFPAGMQYDWRVEIGPYGRCANIIRKEPEELPWHEDWSLAQYGLRARNTNHEQRKVVDVVPASDGGWTTSTDAAGRLTLTRKFELNDEEVQAPYVKIKWSGGDIEILLNGVLVKKKLAGMDEFGAVYLPDEARKTLKPGQNLLVVRSAGKAEALEASAGLIDWRQ